jgi:PAS domain-containing protein
MRAAPRCSERGRRAARPRLARIREWRQRTRARAASCCASALAHGSSREREFDALTAAGEPRRIYWRCIARRAADGTPAGWLCSGADVTDRARARGHTVLAQDG